MDWNAECAQAQSSANELLLLQNTVKEQAIVIKRMQAVMDAQVKERDSLINQLENLRQQSDCDSDQSDETPMVIGESSSTGRKRKFSNGARDENFPSCPPPRLFVGEGGKSVLSESGNVSEVPVADVSNVVDSESAINKGHLRTDKRSISNFVGGRMAEYPPITICVDKPSDVNDVFRMLCEKFGRNWMAIHTQSKQVKIVTKVAVRDKVIASFELNKIKFFTHTPRSQRNINVVVRALLNAEGFQKDDIGAAFSELGLECVRVHPLNVTRNNPNPMMIVWCVSIKKSANYRDIFKVNHILQHRISIETYRNEHIVQCRNSKAFNHTASNCALSYRCVKCSSTHQFGNCTLHDSQPPICVNCGGGHVATNIKECPVAQSVLKKKTEVKAVQRSVSGNPAGAGVAERKNSGVRSGISFANVVKSAGQVGPSVECSGSDHVAQVVSLVQAFMDQLNNLMAQLLCTLNKNNGKC